MTIPILLAKLLKNCCKWKVWSHPPYSPDMTLSMGSKHLAGIRFSSDSEVKTAAENMAQWAG
ncbi:hypothetical protein AVEN_196247-1, partial [Araneus ventricosus]